VTRGKKRLYFLGGLLLAIVVVYLHLVIDGKRWGRIVAAVLGGLVCLYGLLFPDKVKINREETLPGDKKD